MLVEFSFPSVEGDIYFLVDVKDKQQFDKDLKECLSNIIKQAYQEDIEFIKEHPDWKDKPQIRIEHIALQLKECLDKKGYKAPDRIVLCADAWGHLDENGKFHPFYEDENFKPTDFEKLLEEVATEVVKNLNKRG